MLQEYSKLYSVEMTHPNNSPQRLFRASMPAHQTVQATTERCKDKLCYYFRLSLVENLGASYEDHINVLCFAQSLLINYDLH